MYSIAIEKCYKTNVKYSHKTACVKTKNWHEFFYRIQDIVFQKSKMCYQITEKCYE